jgi:hypothetical protein
LRRWTTTRSYLLDDLTVHVGDGGEERLQQRLGAGFIERLGRHIVALAVAIGEELVADLGVVVVHLVVPAAEEGLVVVGGAHVDAVLRCACAAGASRQHRR